MVDLKQTLLKVKSKTTVDVKYSRKEHSARVSSLLRVYEQYERQLEGQVRRKATRANKFVRDSCTCTAVKSSRQDETGQPGLKNCHQAIKVIVISLRFFLLLRE